MQEKKCGAKSKIDHNRSPARRVEINYENYELRFVQNRKKVPKGRDLHNRRWSAAQPTDKTKQAKVRSIKDY
ncbi:MAG: hypothetical protein LBT27_04960 [Prevotellaceae bacterium]|jgi:hypothetical protein|nr:hypothetical protein [Prevotellaceae bacterium]